ncbi:MAG TPA: tyrosine-type recombinase/integrase [Polyangiaceae bacterium]
MPKVGKSPAFPFLYPDEESALMACEQVPLGFRMLWGFLAREGCRVSEALGLTFRDVDLERGAVSLDKNETDDPRTWALDPSVAEALRRWRDRRQARPGEAGVDRQELHERGTNRRPMRAHDLRGTFVTLSLANGRTETWVADRTGHKSSQMINRYRRAARSATELPVGPLAPLAEALPDLNDPSLIHQVAASRPVQSHETASKQPKAGH